MSVQQDILNAAKAVVDALNITNLDCIIRKRNATFDPDDLPIVILVPGRPIIESESTENTIVWIRPLWVTIITPTGDGIIESQFDLLDLEEEIRKALYVPLLPGAATVFHVDMEADDLYVSAANDTGYDLTILRIDYWSQENRN
jgi:hypothetical protein